MQSISANSGTDFSLSVVRLSINQFAVNVLWGGKSVIIRRRSCLYQSANDHRSWGVGAQAAFVVAIQFLSRRRIAIANRTAKATRWRVFGGVQQVALRRSEAMKIDGIHKINKMRKKIHHVNLVNPVYFLRSFHVALRRPGRMKSAVRSPAFRPQASDADPLRDAKRFRLKAGLRTALFILPGRRNAT